MSRLLSWLSKKSDRQGCETMKRLSSQLRTVLRDPHAAVDLCALGGGTALAGAAARLKNKSVLLVTSRQMVCAVALVELDGLVQRMVVAPPDVTDEQLRFIFQEASLDFIVSDDAQRCEPIAPGHVVSVGLPIASTQNAIPRDVDTDWVLMTSGTSGPPKLVAHKLAALTGAIPQTLESDPQIRWATFYDIRRYGGLQIFLRAIIGGTDLVLSSPQESIGDFLRRLDAEKVTSISGTPSQWRRALMSGECAVFKPDYVRLSGEIADQMVLDALRAAFPSAQVGHAYASTEAGVAFAVNDGLEGIPMKFFTAPAGAVEMKIEDGSLRIRSNRRASCYVVPANLALVDHEGFIDTGDLLEQRGDRFVFVGRRGGIINVGGLKVNPEEVEAVINSHEGVLMSLVYARKNPFTGALVVADVVLAEPALASNHDAIRQDIIALCQARLPRQKQPAFLKFVSSLPLTPAGKLSRGAGSPARSDEHA